MTDGAPIEEVLPCSRRRVDGRRSRSGCEHQRAALTSSARTFDQGLHDDEDEELRRAAAEAHQRWRSSKADRSFKPHRLALLRDDCNPGGGNKVNNKSGHGADGSSPTLTASKAASNFKEVDVKKLTTEQQKGVVAAAMATEDPDWQPYLKRLHSRMERVGIQLSSVEVRFEHLDIETDVYVGSRALPTVTNEFQDYLQRPLSWLGIEFSGKRKLPILKDMSGVLKPGRFTLLLGPPSSGKSTLLKALSGKLDMASLCVKGGITYNGHSMDEFSVIRTASYIEQRDVHIAELSVRETLDFSARCQGVGHKAAELQELLKREAEQNILPETDMDTFMKAEAQQGTRYSVVTEMILHLLGLDYVADTLIGGEMVRGISGGQKKRVTTGQMIVGPKKTLFMDEISTGLDSSTAFQIVECMKNFCHLRHGTVLMALLQPAPEVYDLFDDILLLSEGQVVFHGLRQEVVPFFSKCGFSLPDRKGIADFLQEVTSKKDQAQYWTGQGKPYSFVPVAEFAEAFKSSSAGERIANTLAVPFDKSTSPEGALLKGKYGMPLHKILRANLRRELTLITRNSFVYVFRSVQVALMATMASTLIIRTRTPPDNLENANKLLGVLFFSLVAMLFNNWAEFQLLVDRLPTFYKQRDNRFFPAWAFALPTMIITAPHAFAESFIWSIILYWTSGLQPSAGGFFFFWCIVWLMHQFAVSLFRLMGALCKTSSFANASSSVVTLFILINGGFILPRPDVRWWWRWVFYANPMAWGQRSLALNEFRAPRWDRASPVPGVSLGDLILQQRGFENTIAWKWAGVGYMAGAIVVMNIGVILCLTFLDSPDKPGGGTLPEDEIGEKQAAVEGKTSGCSSTPSSSSRSSPATEPLKPSRAAPELALPSADKAAAATHGASLADGAAAKTQSPVHVAVDVGEEPDSPKLPAPGDPKRSGVHASANLGATKKSTLPFDQLWMTFKNVWYSVDLPSGMQTPDSKRNDGQDKSRLYLLNDVGGAFRPNVLTALMGETGAGKTTLLDVLAGRKTGGIIEGDIRVHGHPKEQATFARVSGYVEQNDIHSPQTTVHEALLFSAQLRLPGDLSKATMSTFVDDIMEVVELTPLKGALVGLPGRCGLSVEQRKRLTIAVELVANPSIVFMDEPTSGLDARAAAIVMRAVRNTVDTGRTVVCTIHQPSWDVFESFDELLLLKRGGRCSYSGPLGERSANLINYFKTYEGVPEIKDGYNPATWMLEVTNGTSERRLNQDFADNYKKSELRKRMDQLIEELSVPPEGSQPLSFSSKYSCGLVQQYFICLWKNRQVYWRSPEYNSIRLLFTAILAIILGTSFWGVGNNYTTQSGILAVVGALFAANMFLGVYNASSVQPIVAVERYIFYRERAAGMYSAFPYAIAQGTVELPYILVQSVFFTLLVYSMIKFRWSPDAFFLFLLSETLSLVLFTFYGIVSVALTPNVQVASIVSGTTYGVMFLFCGFIIQAPFYPGWWIWLYYLNPVAWVLYGTVASQLGHLQDQMVMLNDGSMQVVSEFITDYFGYHYDYGIATAFAVLLAMIVIFRLLIVWSYAKLVWEKR